jgi:hypothetical protein
MQYGLLETTMMPSNDSLDAATKALESARADKFQGAPSSITALLDR